MRLFAAGLCLAGLTISLSAQDDAEFQKWMKATGSEMGALRKMESKTGPDAAASADKLAGIYDQVGKYFAAKGAEDAVKIASDAKGSAEALSVAAKAGDADKAGASFKELGGTCKSCHDLHREKLPDGSYKIK